MLVVTRTVVGLAAACGGLEFIGERSRPFLPREVPLLGELDGERERVSLPGLGKRGSALVARQARQRREAFGLRNGIRPAQGSHPTWRDKQNRAAQPVLPTAHARRSAPSIHVAVSRRGNEPWCRDKQRRHD